jgi:hypothetical protein
VVLGWELPIRTLCRRFCCATHRDHRGARRQPFGPVGVGGLDARQRSQGALHAKQGVEHVVGRQLPLARRREHGLDGGGRVARMKHRAGQESDDQAAVGVSPRVDRCDDPAIEELPCGGVELGPRLIVDEGDEQLGAAPRIDEDLAVGAEKAAMGPFERTEPGALLVGQPPVDLPTESPPGDRIGPERTASLLEPGIVGRERPRPRLEERAHLGDALRVGWGPAQLHDPRDGLEHSHPAAAGVPFRLGPRMENRVFFPQAALDEWIVDGTVDLQQSELTILSEGRRYQLAEAVRVLREVGGGGDTHELVGRAKARAYLEQLGAEIVETSMLLGEAAYDIEPGWLGSPVGSMANHIGSEERKQARGGRVGEPPKTDEELLARFVAKNL